MLSSIDCDCPDCAPYCSTDGYCRKSDSEGSTPCQNKECYTVDDCYMEPDVFLRLQVRPGCYKYSPVCQEDHTCAYTSRPGRCRDTASTNDICALQEGVVGDRQGCGSG